MGLGSPTCAMASSGSMFKEEHMVAFWEWSPSAHGPWLPLAPSHDSQMVTDLPPGPGHTPLCLWWLRSWACSRAQGLPRLPVPVGPPQHPPHCELSLPPPSCR